ncbi:ABC transporter ATP-binding protein [Bacillus sp. 22475]|uniref:ABC transporter ATP-binding protein n=1 Tax=Bacillus sp. 22475 TaxID=3453925 RepID=UPI003F82836C
MVKIKNHFNLLKRNLKVFNRVLKILLQCNSKYIALNLLVMLVSSLIPVTLITIMRYLINSLQTLNVNLYATLSLAIFYVLVDLINTLIVKIDSYYGEKFSLKFAGELKMMILKKTKGLSLKQFEDPTIYNVIQRAEQGSEGTLFSYYTTYINVIQKVITLVSVSIVLILWKWWIVLLISLIPIITSLKMLKINEEQYVIRRNRTGKDRMLWYVGYLLTKDIAFKEIKLNNLNSYFVKKYKEVYSFVVNSEMPIIKKRFKFGVLFGVLDQIMLGFIFLLIVIDTFFKKIMLGDTMAYINSVSKVKESVTALLNNIVSIYKESLYISQLFEFLDLPPNYDPKRTYKLEDIHSIEIKNLSYKYKDNQNFVLQNINLSISSNQLIGIVGKNGSGKTTLIRILSGFYDDYEGEVFINNINLKLIDKSSLRKLTSVLFQDFSRYEMTVRENIGVGNLDQINNDDKLNESIEMTGFNKVLNQGLDTQLGNWFDDGTQLSGGEWQKIAISRTLLKNSKFLILDEPTAALDPISEIQLFKNIQEVLSEKISIIITHRITDIEKLADKIIILEEGKIVDSGNHTDLMDNSELYQRMYNKSAHGIINV